MFTGNFAATGEPLNPLVLIEIDNTHDPPRLFLEPIGWVERSETHHLQPCHIHAATNYRRNFICGGSFFFAANLAERRLRFSSIPSFRRKVKGVAAAYPSYSAARLFDPNARLVAVDELDAGLLQSTLNRLESTPAGAFPRLRGEKSCSARPWRASQHREFQAAMRLGPFGIARASSAPCSDLRLTLRQKCA